MILCPNHQLNHLLPRSVFTTGQQYVYKDHSLFNSLAKRNVGEWRDKVSLISGKYCYFTKSKHQQLIADKMICDHSYSV